MDDDHTTGFGLDRLGEPVAGPEELPDEARHLHPIRLTSFVGVMVVTEAVNILLTQRLHFAIPPHSGAGELARTMSLASNSLVGVMLLVAVGTLLVSTKQTPRFALPVMVIYLITATINVLINVGTLVVTPDIAHARQNMLVIDLALVFTATTLVFSLWYQVADTHLPGGAFDFPPLAGDPNAPPVWFDYLVVAFYTNTTFGPTTEEVRTRPARALMMFQTALALVILVVVVARIIQAP